MTNEEFQKVILSKFEENEKIQTVVLNKLSLIEEDVSSMKKDINSMKVDIYSMKEDISSLEEDSSSMKEDIESVKLRQDEIYHIVRAIEHSNQVGRSELDSQNVRLAKVEGKLKKVSKVLDEDNEIEKASNL